MADRQLEAVRCRGCLRSFAVANGPPMHTIFCDVVCASLPAVGQNEERNDLIESLVRLEGWSATQVAVEFDISRQRASQLIKERLQQV